MKLEIILKDIKMETKISVGIPRTIAFTMWSLNMSLTYITRFRMPLIFMVVWTIILFWILEEEHYEEICERVDKEMELAKKYNKLKNKIEKKK